MESTMKYRPFLMSSPFSSTFIDQLRVIIVFVHVSVTLDEGEAAPSNE